jgi:hypothetical protein
MNMLNKNFPLVSDDKSWEFTEECRKYFASWNPEWRRGIVLSNALYSMRSFAEAEGSIAALTILEQEIANNPEKSVKELIEQLKGECVQLVVEEQVRIRKNYGLNPVE